MTAGSVELQENSDENFKRECCSENSLVVAPESKDEEVVTTAHKDMIHTSMNYLRGYEFDRIILQRPSLASFSNGKSLSI